MEVASVRLSEEEKRFLEQLVAKGKYSSISEALKAGINELMREEKLKEIPWRTRTEVRKYFSQKEKKLKGLEALHYEEA
jgi:Arc/MetJ-type ribon-helix-helix transcriptional regulator